MNRLDRREAERFDTALRDLYPVMPFDAFPAHVLRIVGRLIGYLNASYNEIDTLGSSHRVVAEPPEIFRDDLDAAFGRYLHQHPVITHVAANHDSRSRLISDFITRPAFRRLALYNEFYRHIETETQLSITLPSAKGEVVALALNRGRTGFKERERELLDRLAPHLIISHNNAKQLSTTLARTGDQERASAALLERLTSRQHEVLALVAGGNTNAQIAYHLGISLATTKKHLEHIAKRLNVQSRTAAAAHYLSANASKPHVQQPTHDD